MHFFVMFLLKIFLTLFSCLTVNGQFYDDNVNSMKRLNLLQEENQFPYIIGSVEQLLRDNPWLYDPMVLVDSRRLDKISLNGSRDMIIPEFACEMFKKWTAPTINEQCAQGIKDYVCTVNDMLKNGLSNMTKDDTWVIEVLDAIGKPPTGLNDGDLLWLGDYKECKDIQVTIPVPWNNEVKKRHWNGQYCQAFVGLPNSAQKIAAAQCMGQNMTRCSTMSPPIRIGFCAPRGCTNTDLDIVLTEILPIFKMTCNSYVLCEEKAETTWFFWVVLIVVIIICIFLIFGTLFDVFLYQSAVRDFSHERIAPGFSSSSDSGFDGPTTSSGRPHSASIITIDKQQYYDQLGWYFKMLLAFSVYTNGKKLLGTEIREGTMPCIHGIRFLSMAWIILGHTYFFAISYASNIKLMFEIPNQFFFQMVNNATPSVDTFFLLSGFLLSYLFLKRMKSTGGKQLKSIRFWVMYYVHRYIRLTPTYALMMAMGYAFWSHLGEGPLWNNVDKEGMFNKCPKTWWRNIIYINNMWEFGDQCIGWVWYLANDMQFYWVSPPLLILLYCSPLSGVLFSVLLILISAALRGWFVVKNNYPPSVVTSVDPKEWASLGTGFSTYIYQRPWMRVGPYLVGFILGYVLLKTQGKLRIKKFVAFLLWIVIFVITFAVIFGLYDFARGYEMSDTWKGIYAALNRTAWGIAVAGTIYLCLQGYGGFINTVLSWKVWFPLSRLTYCAYLLHEMVVVYFYSTLERPFYVTHYSLIYFFLANLVLAYTLAAVISLAFEAPIMQLEKIIFEPSKKKRTPHAPRIPQVQIVSEQNNSVDGIKEK